MADLSEVVATYIQAKDCNRPWLMKHAFAKDARLEIDVDSDAISFPSSVSGVEAITDTLVRQFSKDNENIYTLCLSSRPVAFDQQFSCNWLVGMSRRESGEVRVGCGRYDWSFSGPNRMLASNLKITIHVMQVMALDHIQPVMSWLSGLPYPWCPARKAVQDIPCLKGLRPVSDFLLQRA